MSRRAQFGLYFFLSVVDFAATVFLISHGYADEGNPFINGFTSLFSSFAVGLAVYKTSLIVAFVFIIRTVHKQNPIASRRLLLFANSAMVCLSGWHIACLHIARVI